MSAAAPIDDFPYKRDRIDADACFHNLRTRSDGVVMPVTVDSSRVISGIPMNFMGKPCLIAKCSKNYEQFGILTEYFSERVRVRASVFGHPSPHQYYLDNKEALHKQSNDPEEIRELIWRGGAKEATLFNPAIAKWVFQTFKSRKVLDPSAGWGDRILGAMGANVDEYTGVDPNSKMTSVYKQIIDFGRARNCFGEYAVHTEDFLEYKIVDEYDTVFTSPPFFDYEIYSDDKKQSVAKYPNLHTWTRKFMLPYIDKCIGALAKDGVLVLYLSDTSRGKYMKNICRHIRQKHNVRFLGIIGMVGSNVLPLWVWQNGDKEITMPPQKAQTGLVIPSNAKSYVITETIADLKREPLEPPMLVKKFTCPTISFTVLDDGVLLGGTKQRGLNRFVEQSEHEEFVYAGPETGFAQLALSIAATAHGKKAKIFVGQYGDKPTPISTLAMRAGGSVKAISRAPLSVVQQSAMTYVKNMGACLVEFGGRNMYGLYLQALRDAVEGIPTPKRLWITSGSGFTLEILQAIWPTTRFQVVQVGKSVGEYIRGIDTHYVSPHNFYKNCTKIPPYSSLHSYDAKLWEMFLAYGEDGDVIWNIARNI